MDLTTDLVATPIGAGCRVCERDNCPQRAFPALGRALAEASDAADIDPATLALAAQTAEHDWAGVHCGIMDQMAVAAGKPGHALLLERA